MPPRRPPSDPALYKDALDFFRALVPMTDAEFYELDAAARARAFTVSGLQSLDTVTDVHKALTRAISKGHTLEDFKAAILEKLKVEWGGEKPGRVETIFRTNVQTAYSAGRYAQQTKPHILKRRPYWKFLALLDDRTTPICRPLNGKVYPADHPIWHRFYPPNHFRCRSSLFALTKDEAEEAGISTEEPQGIQAPPEGFDTPPGLRFKADTAGYPPELVRAKPLKPKKG